MMGHPAFNYYVMPYAKWHPWFLTAVWVSDLEFAKKRANKDYYWSPEGARDWSLGEAMDWVNLCMWQNLSLIYDVNAAPLHTGLVYPDNINWIEYVVKDLIELGWAVPASPTTYNLVDNMPFTAPAEWLASQLGGQVAEAMSKLGMKYLESYVKPSMDQGYTKRWEKLTRQQLCGKKFGKESQFPNRYSAR